MTDSPSGDESNDTPSNDAPGEDRHGEPLGRRYWTLWSAFSTSNLADGLSLVAFPLIAVSLTDDARLVAVVAAARVLPFLIISLPAGVLIDRRDRRHLAMIAQVIRAAVLVAAVALLRADTMTIVLLSLAAFATGAAEVLIDGGLPAIVRDTVKAFQLEDANARLRAAETVSNNFIGPPLGAVAFQWDTTVPLLMAAGLYLASIGMLMRLPGNFTAERTDRAGFTAQMREGLSYVWNSPILRPLAFAVAAFAFVGNARDAIFVIFVTEYLGWSDVQFGLLISVDAVASATMAFFVTRLVRRTSHGTSMQMSVASFAAHAAILAFFTPALAVIAAILLAGFSDPTWNVISSTVRQRLVDDRIFGRMMTSYLFISWSLQPIGALAGGWIAEAWGSQTVYILGAVIVGSLLLFARPLFRRIDDAMAAADGRGDS
ncbi:MAG: MFS transporter [Actinomycetota bacterium]